MENYLPVGKLPPALLSKVLAAMPTQDSSVVLGPGIGLDCAILDISGRLLVLKSEPITFATDEIGWYSIQIAANDIATTGAVPRWALLTLLLPEARTDEDLAETISHQVGTVCKQMGITVIGGHTEITYGLDRPIINTTLIGEVLPERFVSPRGIRPGNRVLLTKSVPIEAVAVLAHEKGDILEAHLEADEWAQAKNFLYEPGISVVEAARIATETVRITAMHDPTEGGLITALWELAEAGGVSIEITLDAVPIDPISRKVCELAGIDPLAALASGALIITTASEDVKTVQEALIQNGIACTEIGRVYQGPPNLFHVQNGQSISLTPPLRDEIARVMESH